MNIRKIVSLLLSTIITCCSIFIFGVVVSADTLTSDLSGCAILCNGGWGFGHAALMNGDELLNPNGTSISNAVIEVHHIFHPVVYADYYAFISNDNAFLGYYSPIMNMTDSQKSSVRSRAIQLKNYSDAGEITYTVIGQLSYSGYQSMYFNGESGIKVIQPSNVTKLRCDGYVEYCYERNNIAISGSNDQDWNIAIANASNQAFHNGSLTQISPKIQAYYFMKSMVGDINEDGSITAADARIALRIATDLDIPAAYHQFVGDVNDDGNITSADARYILRYTTGAESTFPKNSNIRTSYPNNSLGLSSYIIDMIWNGEYPIIL